MKFNFIKNNIKILGLIKFLKLNLKNKFRIFNSDNEILVEETTDLKNVIVKIKGIKNKVFFRNIKLRNTNISVIGNNNILKIDDFSFFQNSSLVIIGNNSKIEIGKNSSIYGIKIWNLEGNGIIKIGDECLISHDVEIRNTDSHPIYEIATNKRINYSKNVILKNRVWLGSGVRILKGVVIEEGNIIGQQSIISKSILEKNCICVGNGRIIKKNIKWEKEFV